MKQEQTRRHKEQTYGCHGGGEVEEEWIGSLGLADATYWVGQKVHLDFSITCYSIIYKMDKQQGPTVQHSELYSMSWDKP